MSRVRERHYRKREKPRCKFSETHLKTLELWFKGYEIKELARLRGCEVRTIESHVEDLLRATGTHNSRELLYEALAMGLVTPPQRYAQADEVLFVSRNWAA